MTDDEEQFSPGTSALELCLQQTKFKPIITFCKELDEHVHILPGLITEFCGGPGTGKTNMCLQLCVNVQLPEEFGGLNGEAIFIDTNQGYRVERLKSISSECAKRLNKKSTTKVYTVDSILENIYYHYCQDYIQLVIFILRLESLLTKNPKIRLIIIDSFSFPFRTYEDVLKRNRNMWKIVSKLKEFSSKNNLVIVLTNELTRKFLEKDEDILCPALGECFSIMVDQRIVLSNFSNQRFAYLEKIQDKPNLLIPFKITDSSLP